eukprot:jgi/Tetstr1/426160/TSEL_016487.t1
MNILCKQEESKPRERVCRSVLVSLADVRAVAVVRDAEGDERFDLRQAPNAEIPDLPELGKNLWPIIVQPRHDAPSGDAAATSHWAEMQGETGARVRFHPD